MPIEKIINSALKFIELKFKELGDIIVSQNKKSSESETDLTPAINNQTAILSTIVSRVENAIDKIKDPKFSGEISVDTSSLENELSGIAKDLKKVSNTKTPDLKNVEFLLKQVTKSLEAILLALGGIKPIDTFKLDDMQLRKLAGASKGVSVNGGNLAARNVAITNLALTATNTQYSFTFPANTTFYRLKLRDQGVLTFYSFTTGTLPLVGGGGDGTKYTTIPQNFVQSQEGVDFSGKVIYFGSESASQVLEIEVYTL